MEDNIIFLDIEKMMLTSNGKRNLIIRAEVKTGELLALYGSSGAGKTTLLRILAGLTKPDKGLIQMGKTIWFDSAKKINLMPQKRSIGFMFQDFALFPNMTVSENIRFAQNDKNNNHVAALLEAFGLSEFKNHKTTNLSGGQKQRVALARALASKPKLLLLDEPLSAIDAEMRAKLQDEIAQAHKILSATTIMVSHDLNEVFRLATKVLCIENGTVKKAGTPEEVFSENSISGKVQICGQIVRIEKQDIVNIITIISGNNQITKVIAFENDIEKLQVGDQVIVFTKAFNPMIVKVFS